eukprot:9805803-Ditylum_brightwellii.AAC.1
MALMQYLLKAGLKKFKNKGAEAVIKEFKQLNGMGTFEPKDTENLSDGEKENLLESLAFISKNQDRRIKCRSCTNGSKQRGWHTKEIEALLAVAMESALLTGGKLVELMVITALEMYHKYIAVDRKETSVLYLWHQKVLYGRIRGILSFYRRLTEDLKAHSFKTNRYDNCMANKIVKGNH